MHIFLPSAEGRQPVWVCLWFKPVAQLGLKWLVLFQCEAFLPFGQVYIHLTTRFFLGIAWFCPCLVRWLQLLLLFFVLILCPLYPNTQMAGGYVWVGCNSCQVWWQVTGTGVSAVLEWGWCVTQVTSSHLLAVFWSHDSGLRSYHCSTVVFTVVMFYISRLTSILLNFVSNPCFCALFLS